MIHLPIKVIIVDDHPALLIGMQHALSIAGGIDVVGSASDSSNLVALLKDMYCDVIVTDYVMPNGNYGDGLPMLSLLRRRYPQMKIVVYTMMDNPGVIRSLILSDFLCVVSKADPIDNLARAVHAAMARRSFLSPTFHIKMGLLDKPRMGGLSILSSRELEVLRLYLSGETVGQIAALLHRSNRTISAQKMSAMRKLGISRESDLYTYALEAGLIQIPNPSSSSSVLNNV